jgi:hypothetical protein
VDEFTEADWARLEELGAVSLHTNHKKLDAKNIARLHERGYRVMLYTVNDAAPRSASSTRAWTGSSPTT